MAFTVLEQYTISVNSVFLSKLVPTITAAAILIHNEGVGVSGHAIRLAFAKLVLANPTTYVPAIALGMTTDGTTDSNTSDVNLLSRVLVLWNIYSGNVP